MSYEKAIEATGAKIIAFKSFGSYQGEWWCLCKYKGEIGWITGSYGSCSGCDAFENEFDWDYENDPLNLEKLKVFGLRYLDPLLTQQQALKEASQNDWDDEAKNMVDFIKNEWDKLMKNKGNINAL